MFLWSSTYTWKSTIKCVNHGSLVMSPLNNTQPLDSIRYMVYNGYFFRWRPIYPSHYRHLPNPEKSHGTPIYPIYQALKKVIIDTVQYTQYTQVMGHLPTPVKSWKNHGTVGDFPAPCFFQVTAIGSSHSSSWGTSVVSEKNRGFWSSPKGCRNVFPGYYGWHNLLFILSGSNWSNFSIFDR